MGTGNGVFGNEKPGIGNEKPKTLDAKEIAERDKKEGTNLAEIGQLVNTMATTGKPAQGGQKHYRLAKTSDILKDVGLTGEYFTIKSGVISKHYGKDVDHVLTPEDWANISEALKDPLVVARYSRKGEDGLIHYPKNQYKIWVEAQINGKYAMVGVEVKSPGKDITVNSVTTVYGDEHVSLREKDVIYSRGNGEGIRTLLNGPNPRQYSESPTSGGSIPNNPLRVNEGEAPNFAAAQGAAENKAVELKPVDGKPGQFTTLSHPEARFTVYGDTSTAVARTLAVDGLTEADFEPGRIGQTAALIAKVEAYAANHLMKIGFRDDGVQRLWETVRENIKAEGKEAYAAEQMEAKRQTVVEQLKKSGLADGVVETAEDFERLFQELSGEALRAGEEVYGFCDPKTKKVYLNPAFFATGQGLEVPIHEFGHLGVIACEKVNKAVYDQGMKLAKELLESGAALATGTDWASGAPEPLPKEGATGVRGLVDFILKDRVYSKQSREQQAQELLAQLIGKRGEEALKAETNKSVVAKVKAWLVEFWNTFGKALGLKDITPEEAAKMTLEDVADAIRAEMLSGRKYGEGFDRVEFSDGGARVKTKPVRIKRKMTGRRKAVNDFVARMGGAEDPTNTETDLLALWVDNGGRLFEKIPYALESGYSKGASGVKKVRSAVDDEFVESTSFYKDLNAAQRKVYFGTGKQEYGSVGGTLMERLEEAGITRFTGEDGMVDFNALIGEFERQWTNYKRGEAFLKERGEWAEEHDRAIVEEMERAEAAERAELEAIFGKDEGGAAFSPEEAAAQDAQMAAELEEGMFSRKGGPLFARKGKGKPKKKVETKYSYDSLTAKPAMKVPRLGTVKTKTKLVNGKSLLDTDDILRQAVGNIEAGGVQVDGKSAVHVADLGRDVVVDYESLRHTKPQAIAKFPDVYANYGRILANSIIVNEASPADPKRSIGEYVAVGMAINRRGRPVFVRSVIDSRNGIDKISRTEVVYAVDARKGNPAFQLHADGLAGEGQSRAHVDDGIKPSSVSKSETEVSIADFLAASKGVFRDVFSQDVNEKLEVERDTETKLGKSLLFSRFAGEKGTANMGVGNADRARSMESEGADREKIWRETGWWKGKDGKWRFELPNVRMKGEEELESALLEGVTGLHDGSSETTLEKVLEAPELFTAYPQLKDTKIVFSPEHDDKSGGWYNKEKNEIVILDTGFMTFKRLSKHDKDLYDTYQRVIDSEDFNQQRLRNMDALGIEHGTAAEEREHAKKWIAELGKRIQDDNAAMVRNLVRERGPYSTFGKIVHEVQHAIQGLEGFAKGGSPESADALVKNMKRRQRIWAYRLEVEETAKELGTTNPYEIEKAILGKLGVTSREQVAGLEAEGWIPDKAGRDKGYNLFARGYDKEGYEEAYDKYLGEMRKSGRASWWDGSPNELYNRLAGEVEARNASRREAMSPEERAATPPWETEDVPESRQIVKFAAGRAVNRTPEETEAIRQEAKSKNDEANKTLDKLTALKQELDAAKEAGGDTAATAKKEYYQKINKQFGSDFAFDFGRPYGRLASYVPDRPLRLTMQVLLRKMKEEYRNHHPFTFDEAKDLAINVNDPAFFMRRDGATTGVRAFYEVGNGRIFCVSIKPNGEINEIETLYPKDIDRLATMLASLKKKNALLDLDIDKAVAMLERQYNTAIIPEASERQHNAAIIPELRDSLKSAISVLKDVAGVNGENLENSGAGDAAKLAAGGQTATVSEVAIYEDANAAKTVLGTNPGESAASSNVSTGSSVRANKLRGRSRVFTDRILSKFLEKGKGGAAKFAARMPSQSGQEYTYTALTAKPDMPVVQVDAERAKQYGDHVSWKLADARKSILAAGGRLEKGHYVIDMEGEPVEVGKRSILHGKHNRNNDFIYPVLGEVLKNAVRVNELGVREELHVKGKKDDQVNSKFVYLGAAAYGDEVLPVRIQIDRKAGLSQIGEIDVLKSFNAKRRDTPTEADSTGHRPPRSLADARAEAPTEADSQGPTPAHSLASISISNLIGVAQPLHPQIFSKDVAAALNKPYQGGEIGALFSRGGKPPEAEHVKLTRVADDAGQGEQTPGAMAASRELSRQGAVPINTKGTRYVSLPMSEMNALARYLTGHAMPAEMESGRKLGAAGKASYKHRKLTIAADVLGVVDKTDMAAEKAMLKQHGFFAHEDSNWCATHSPAEVRKERERSEEALSSQLEKLADKRIAGREPGGMAAGRKVFADQLAQVVMTMPHGQPGALGAMQTVAGALEKRVRSNETEAETFLDWMEGVSPGGAGASGRPARSAQERKAGMFAAFLIMPKEMEARAKGWYDAIRSTIAGDQAKPPAPSIPRTPRRRPEQD